MTFVDLLKMLLPYRVYSDSDLSFNIKDITVFANALQSCQDNAAKLLLERFPDSAESSLPDWERVYGLINSSQPLFQRRQNAHAAYMAKGALHITGLQQTLTPFLGYLADVENYAYFYSEDENSLTSDDGVDVEFYAGDEDTLYDFTVFVDQSKITTDGFDFIALQKAVDKLKPSHTNGLLDFGGDGFYSNDDNSLTELTLTSDS